MSKANRSKSVLSRVVFEAIENRLLLSAGALDTDFGVLHFNPPGLEAGQSFQWAKVMATQEDGKILLGGRQAYGLHSAVCVIRTGADGELDPSFGSGGAVTIDVTNLDDDFEDLFSMAVSDTGKIYLAGQYDGYTTDDLPVHNSFVIGLNSTGSPLSGFGTSGILTLGNMDNIRAITAYTDTSVIPSVENLYLAGINNPEPNAADPATINTVSCISAVNGAPVTGFGGGQASFAIPNTTSDINSILVTSVVVDNKTEQRILIGGTFYVNGEYDQSWLIASFKSNGTLDTNFGGGYVSYKSIGGLGYDSVYSLIETEAGIVAGGLWSTSCGVATISSTGVMGPLISIAMPGEVSSNVNVMTVDNDGNIIVAGTTTSIYIDPILNTPGSDADVLLAQVKVDAATGLSLNKDFVFSYGFDVPLYVMPESPVGVSVQPDGRLVVGNQGFTDSNVPNQGFYANLELFAVLGSDVVEPPINTVPVAHPIVVSPAAVYEGTPVSLAGGFDDSDEGDFWTFNWSIFPDNGQVVPEGTTLNYSFTPVDNGTYYVIFTVTDFAQTSSSVYATIVVNNLAPVASIDGPASAALYTATLYTATVTDAANDAPTIAWTVTNASNAVVATGAGPQYIFTPTEPGDYTLSATATDKDGASTTVAKAVTVSAMVVVGSQLIVGSGNSSNNIIVSSSNGQISVYLDGKTTSFIGVNQISLFCGGGNDIVIINPFLGVSCDVYGGDGNDILSAGSGGDMLVGGAGADMLIGMGGADILVGGDGNDLIAGGNGNDLIIGGHGADLLLGNADQDILVAGTTSYDNNPTALKAILAEWSSSRTYTQRVKNITDGTGTPTRLNGANFLAVDATVFDDAARDSLAGNSGTDFFIFNADFGVRDLLIDRSTAESAFDVDVNA